MLRTWHDAQRGGAGDDHLAGEAVHGPAAVLRVLVTRLGVVHQQLASRQHVELAVWNNKYHNITTLLEQQIWTR